MTSSSVLSLGNRLRAGQESRRILSPTEQHSGGLILGPNNTPSHQLSTHRRDRSQRYIERSEKHGQSNDQPNVVEVGDPDEEAHFMGTDGKSRGQMPDNE